MGTTAVRAPRRVLCAGALALAALALAAATNTDPVQARGSEQVLSQLRVEGPRTTLDPGTWYVTGSEAVRKSRGDRCRHRSGKFHFPGPNALGIAQTGSEFRDSLAPVRARNSAGGRFMCEIGGIVGRPGDHPDGFSGWLYWVDYAAGFAPADQTALTGDEQVLWVFADFGQPSRNSGRALELSGVPASDADGELTVEVAGHRFDGSEKPIEGASISGVEGFTDIGNGLYEITADEGMRTIYAERGRHIRSNRFELCYRPGGGECPTEHGRVIVGSRGADDLLATGGWDEVHLRRGADHVDITDGGRDEVDCGGGDDVVTRIQGDTDDELSDCEEVDEVT